ncbi:MAG: SDR family oxidoreductase [Anaerolineae bacterium]|nr:SDR family oxidoreductase [Anaerolineae bacterium]
MGFDLSGKRALLAGTVDDLLIGVGKALFDSGAHLLATEASPHWGDLPHEIVALNGADPEILHEQIKSIGAVDVLVFNAGWRRHAAFLDHTPADWDAALTANFETPVYLAQAAVLTMIDRGQGGRIIFLSGVESLMPFAGTSAAGATLTMLGALAKMMAVDLASHGITVNVLSYGWLNSEKYIRLPETSQQHIVNGIPLKRTGTPAEVGAVVTFLASNSADYITGTMLPIDGGYVLTRSPGSSMLDPCP